MTTDDLKGRIIRESNIRSMTPIENVLEELDEYLTNRDHHEFTRGYTLAMSRISRAVNELTSVVAIDKAEKGSR